MQDRDRSVAPDLNLPQPPHDLKAEQAVLGALLLEKKVAMPVFQMLKAWCFYETVHQQIFEAMQALFARNIPIDVLTLTTELRRHNLLDVIGGSYYLTGLADLVPSTANVQYYVEVVL